MTWQERFDRLLHAMSQGEPHKAEKRVSASKQPQEPEPDVPSAQRTKSTPE